MVGARPRPAAADRADPRRQPDLRLALREAGGVARRERAARSASARPADARPLDPGAQDLYGDLGDLRGVAADADAVGLQRLGLRDGGSLRPGHDRPGVAHRLAGRRREPRDVRQDGFRDRRRDVLGRLLLRRPADLPHITISSVSGSASNCSMMSMKLEPGTGSPPMPTIDELPKPLWASSFPIWYVSVPERDTRPTLPSLKNCAGMIPTFAFPGDRIPGQLGPTRRD